MGGHRRAVGSRGRARVGLLVGVVAASLAAAGLGVWAWSRGEFGPGTAESPYDRGDYRAAADSARETLRERPNDPEALRLLARSSMHLGRSDLARGIYTRLGPDAMEPEDHVLFARELIRSGRNEAAASLLTSALKADPVHPEALAELARIRASADRLAEAAALADRLVEVPGQRARGLFARGIIHHQQDHPGSAVEAIDAALALDPKLVGDDRGGGEFLRTIARDALAAGRPDRALQAAESLRAVAPAAEVDWLIGRARLQKGEIAEAAEAAARAGDLSLNEPEAHEPAPYVGARTCRPCHPEIAEAHAGSHHASTYLAAADFGELPGLGVPHPDPADPDVTLTYIKKSDGRFCLRAESDGEATEALIEFVFGSGDRGATPVGVDPEGRPRELRLSHYGAAGWDVTTGHPQAVESEDLDDHLGLRLDDDELRRCLECHVTNTLAAVAGLDLDPSTSSASARASDNYPTAREAIGCERCHGPGGHHVRAMAVAPAFPDVAIGRPRLADNVAIVALCARCHSPRGNAVSRTDPAAIRFQGTTLTWSRCYTESQGALSCVTCHDPHRDAEMSHGYYDAKCLTCHDPTVESPRPQPEGDGARPIAVDPSMPRTACPVEPEGDCVNCHMPARSGLFPHTTFTDHNIRSRPETD